MRYLNKIVFLNSAHIRYAEVKLDGNVHFIGTQGVGKSTLLRALLFFYNADKTKLGIPKEKKGFDSFYFMYANSYIVYEVYRESGAYCVLAFRSQGRTSYRFIDAPYERSFFVNSQDEVYSEWGKIREQIGKEHYVSPIIDRYDEYRDIIFGNNRGLRVEYRKFAIVESIKYQNIPRTIQNVFLNSKLDADFIKDTIIHSMNDEESSIDLIFYRQQLSKFEQEYTDIMLWFAKNKNGEIMIRKMAQKVMGSYRNLLYTRKLIRTFCGELNFAVRKTLQDIPLAEDDIRKTALEVERLQRLITELTDKYQKERDGLVSEMAVIEQRLREVKTKRLEYDRLHIAEIIKRVEKETLWKDERKHLGEMKEALTREYADVTTKYCLLRERLEHDFNYFAQTQQGRIVEKKAEHNVLLENLMAEWRSHEVLVRDSYEEKFRTGNEKMNQLNEENAACKEELIRIRYRTYYGKEIADCDAAIAELIRQNKDWELDLKQKKQSCDQLISECDLQRKSLEHTFQVQAAVYVEEQDKLSSKIREIDELLEKRKGSLYEWLNDHKSGWKQNIGKIVDEERILYNSALRPCLNAGSEDTSLFGITLDLDAIDTEVRTPEEYLLEKETYETGVKECKRALSKLLSEKEVQIEALERKYSKQIREIKNEIHLIEAEMMKIPARLKNQQADRNSFVSKGNEEKEKADHAIREKQNEIAHRCIQATQVLSKFREEREKRLKGCQKEYKDTKEKQQNEVNLFLQELNRETAKKQEETKARLARLQIEMEAELEGKGVDVDKIKELDALIATIDAELAFVEQNRKLVFGYQKDKEDLFDNENFFRQQKQDLDNRRNQLEEKYNLRREKLQAQQNDISSQLIAMNQELDAMNEGVRSVDLFRKDELFCPPEMAEAEEIPTRKSCSTLLEELKKQVFTTHNRQEEFKKWVNGFKSNFSSKNTFNFRLELNNDADYMEFAADLCEFVDNDKIMEYQKRISERYTDIIQRIAKEVSDITNHESEVHKTINAINADFVERGSFAYVIKDISLRSVPSSDKLMQLLLQIKNFNDENQFNMGAVDLFSQSSREEVNAAAVRYLFAFMKLLLDNPSRPLLTLSDTFKLEFRIIENDNDTGWVEKVSNVGSDGTDILVKAMVNIMLINVFKEGASRKFGDFKIHCMMDEIGKLHPNNVKGILDFANSRNILLINSSPMTYNVNDYRYTYFLKKDQHSDTLVIPLLAKKEVTTV